MLEVLQRQLKKSDPVGPVRLPSDEAPMAEVFTERFVSDIGASAFQIEGVHDVDGRGPIENIHNDDYEEMPGTLTIDRYEPGVKFGFRASYSF